MIKLVEEFSNNIYLLVRVVVAYFVCFAYYLIIGPGGVGGMVLYFMLMALLIMPITLWYMDILRGLTGQAIAVRTIVTLVSGLIYMYWMVSMSYIVSPINLSFAGPLVAAATSDLFLRDGRKKS